MKNMNCFFNLNFKIFILLIFSSSFYGQDAKEIAKKCLPSTVSLILEDNFKQPLALGSGFIISDGKIITNLHVVENAHFGYVKINGDSKKHNIEGYYNIDTNNDLILLSVPTLKGTSIEINKVIPEIGEKIYAIGSPKGLSGSISEGIVSGIRTFDGNELIQITAPISPGSSGGPVIDNEGKLIGVSVGAIDSGQNLNFAVPTKYVELLVKSAPIHITRLNIKTTITKKNSTKGEKSIKQGIEIINIEWEADDGGGYYSKPIGYDLEGFSIKNNLQYEIKKVKLLLILKNSQGVPIDSQEYEPYIGYDEYIKPFLSKYIEVGFSDSRISDRIKKRKPSEKLEIRILDFTIIE